MKLRKLFYSLFLAASAIVFNGCKEDVIQSCTDSIQNGLEVGVDCGGSCPECFICGTDTVMDVDGNVYKSVQIGDKCLLAENLRVERYRNGDFISAGLSNIAWSFTTSGATAFYEELASNKAIYGLLYNWYTVVDPRGLCPIGWHVPTDAEWTEIIKLLDPSTCDTCEGSYHSRLAGGDMKATGNLIAGTGLWQDPNVDATNSSGFSAIPGGFRNEVGDFYAQGVLGYYWSSSESTTSIGRNRGFNYTSGYAFRSQSFKRTGFSVRGVQD
ncbi:MAG: hypothetical protein GC205_11585 [Bacteroidetes bacterium]|nr:hypothetical protein [Bacteroidota bacterium]